MHVAADKKPDANPEANTADAGNIVRSEESDMVFDAIFLLQNKEFYRISLFVLFTIKGYIGLKFYCLMNCNI